MKLFKIEVARGICRWREEKKINCKTVVKVEKELMLTLFIDRNRYVLNYLYDFHFKGMKLIYIYDFGSVSQLSFHSFDENFHFNSVKTHWCALIQNLSSLTLVWSIRSKVFIEKATVSSNHMDGRSIVLTRHIYLLNHINQTDRHIHTYK